MKKSFKDVVQDFSRTGLGIPVKTKKSLFRTMLLFRHRFTRNPPSRSHAHDQRTDIPCQVRKNMPSSAAQPLEPPTRSARPRVSSFFKRFMYVLNCHALDGLALGKKTTSPSFLSKQVVRSRIERCVYLLVC